MSSAFERLQKLAEEKRLKEKAEKPRLEIVPVNIEERPSAPSAVSAPSAGSQKLPVAPEKDFAKVANSIVRQIPNGAFIGKSKQMYDYLYSLTRGAIKPTRSVRVSKSTLMRGSGIKSTHTFYNNVHHLEAIGLIITTRIDGEKGGNSYEVMLPEEIEGDLEQLAQLAQLGQLTQLAQKLPVAVSAETALPALGSNSIDTDVSRVPKTSLKTNTNDDEAFAGFIEKIQAVAEEISGKKLSKRDSEYLEKIADLLVLELKIAARRTDSISSVSAFLTEVLRRRLRDTPTNTKLSKVKSDTVGKPDTNNSYERKPLDAKDREAALEQLREFANDEFLQDFKKWYVKEDWKWMMKELGIN